MPMPYVGFLFMFMTFEPVAVLFLIFAAYPTYDMIAIMGLAVLLILPALYVGYKLAIQLAYSPKFKKRNVKVKTAKIVKTEVKE
jgi:uncharacterized membrane protein YqjE